MRLPLRRAPRAPAVLAGRLAPDELVTAVADIDNGGQLVTTRRGLWVLADGEARRLGWEAVAKARLESATLTVIAVTEIDVWPDGTSVVRDSSAVEFRLTKPAKVTDQVHARVRRSVAASRYLSWPRAGGWVALRRVPGRDGLLIQVRLDPGADLTAAGFTAAVARVATELAGTDPVGTIGVDE